MVQQHGCYVVVPVTNCTAQGPDRTDALAAGGVWVGAFRKQNLDHAFVTALGGSIQDRTAARFSRLDIRSVVQ